VDERYARVLQNARTMVERSEMPKFAASAISDLIECVNSLEQDLRKAGSKSDFSSEARLLKAKNDTLKKSNSDQAKFRQEFMISASEKLKEVFSLAILISSNSGDPQLVQELAGKINASIRVLVEQLTGKQKDQAA
jgi:hypothetical protein